MDTTPYWSDGARIKRYPKLDRDFTVDVGIIGGGITGITAAYLLKQSGASVVLLERGRFGDVDTGHTTAHLTCVTDSRLGELVKDFGRDHAQAVWDAGLAAMDRIEQIVNDLVIPCEYTRIPGYLHAPVTGSSPEEQDCLRQDAELAAELGFDAELVAEAPLVKQPAVRFPNQAKFHPRKYIAALLQATHGKDCHLFEESEVEEIQGEPMTVKANGHTVKCTHLFIATHVPLQGLTGTVSAALFQTKLAPYTSYAIGAKIPSGFTPEASFWDTKDPYDYLRIDHGKGHDYAIFGGNDNKTGQQGKTESHFKDLENRLCKLIPKASVDHYWSGQVIETADGLPFIGETAPKQFVATGFSGNGMTFGTLGAMMVCEAINGHKSPWSDLFDVNRKSTAGAWDYLRENKDYPYYMIKGHLWKPAPGSLRSIKRGEGKIVIVDGKKIAAYRDADGKLTKRSAVCTHMGCIVRWNSAEKTWECPCHGSRFQATGEVIAGPAESPLQNSG